MAKKGKKIAFKIKDTFTFVVAVIILAVAVLWFLYQEKQKEVVYSGLTDIFTGVSTSQSGQMRVHFINVGQGDCVFIELPDGKSIIIDGADRGQQDIIINYLNELEVEEITLAIATHTDADHIGSLDNVFEEYKINYCLRPFVYYNGDHLDEFNADFNLSGSSSKGYKCSTATYYNFLTAILNEGCGYEYFNKNSDFTQAFTYQGEQLEYSLDFLTPISDVNDIAYSDPNDYSPIFILSYGDFDIMFTGDSGEVGETEFLNAYTFIPEIEILKVGHHGSKYSSIPEFIQKVSPKDAVFSCGQGNSYGHPSQTVIDRLLGVNSKIYRTDLQGHIVFTINANGSYDYQVQTYASSSDLITGIPD